MINRGKITRIVPEGIYVSVPNFAVNMEFGPCQNTSDTYRVDDDVLVAEVGNIGHDLVLLGHVLEGNHVGEGIPAFANAAERDEMMPSSGGSSLIWLTDTSQLQYRNGNGWVTLNNKAGVGLGNVDNTSDANKPTSTETQQKINKVVNDTNLAFSNFSTTVDTALGLKMNKNATVLGSTNLNTLWEPGTYYQGATSNATAVNGYPVPNAGTLFVQRSSTGPVITQLYSVYSTAFDFEGAIYSRTLHTNGTVGAWRRLDQPNVLLLDTFHLDSIETNGSYLQPASANATAARGYPTGLAGNLEVRCSETKHMVYQTYTTYNNNGTYKRQRYNGTWTRWHLVGGVDSGWVNLSARTGYTAVDSPAVRNLNGVAHFRGAFNRTAGGHPVGYFDVCYMPAGFEPESRIRRAVGSWANSSSSNVVGSIESGARMIQAGALSQGDIGGSDIYLSAFDGYIIKGY